MEPEKASPLRRRMTVVMYAVIFLYAAAFWIQTGVLPVYKRNRNAQRLPVSHIVPLQKTGRRSTNVWLHGDGVCRCYAPGWTSLWEVW